MWDCLLHVRPSGCCGLCRNQVRAAVVHHAPENSWGKQQWHQTVLVRRSHALQPLECWSNMLTIHCSLLCLHVCASLAT